jgi:hyperosmotically inducible periplasmic protein
MKLARPLTALAMAVFLAGAAGCASTDERRATGQIIDDASLTARVKTALVKADGINANAINVNTYRGEVILSGFVEDRQMIDRAASVARNIDGVRTVRNDLHVTPRR